MNRSIMDKEYWHQIMVAVLAVSLLGLAGCADQASDPAQSPAEPPAIVSEQPGSEQGAADKGVILAENVSWDMNADFVVVGAGMSGLTAAVEALDQGRSVIVLESQNMVGGNGSVTSCVMGVGTRIQNALGIELTPAQIITLEMETFNYSVDGTRWSKVIQNSADNDELIARMGYNVAETEIFGMPGHDGDGITMALAAGGKSWLDNASLMEYPMNPAMGRSSSFLSRNPSTLWVNGDGLRFVDENCGEKVPGRAAQAVRSQEVTYAVFDQTLMDEIAGAGTDNAALVEKAVADGHIFKADTLEELAAKAGIAAETFIATVEKYNAFCENGEDVEFGKKAEHMKALTAAPYYMSKNSGIYFLTTIGGLDTTPYGQVRSVDVGVAPNLYAVGVDGVALYKGLYTIDIPGSCNSNNIWSGRTAVQHACGEF